MFPILIGIFYGIEYMLWGVFNPFLQPFLNSHYSADLIRYSTIEQIKDVLPVLWFLLIVSTVMVFSSLDISVCIQLPISIYCWFDISFCCYERLRLLERVSEVNGFGLSAFFNPKEISIFYSKMEII